MEDLLQSQIHDSCKLALPEGLKDLMSDISREVLRAQPTDINKFIAEYLGALLKAREALYIASHVCSYLCNCLCHADFDHEIREIGLTDEDIATIKQVIQQQVGTGRVEEKSILSTLIKKTSLDATQLETIQIVIRKAFEEYKLNHTEVVETEQCLHSRTSHDNSQEPQQDHLASPPGTTASASTLAGSHVELPQHRPYSVHDHDSYSLFSEKIHWAYDHTLDNQDKVKQNMMWDTISLDSGIIAAKEIPTNVKKIDTHFIRSIIPHLKDIEEVNDSTEDDVLSNESNDSNISPIPDNLDVESLHFISKIRDRH